MISSSTSTRLLEPARIESRLVRPVAIGAALAGERIFVTGSTGFIGKVLVEKLLWSVPEVGRLLLLVRADGDAAAAERLRREVFVSPVFARLRALHGSGWDGFLKAKVEAVAGDLARERLGIAPQRYAELAARIDRVVACAATVRFDERLDRAVEINARGALRTLTLARDAGDAPLAHVSTCFVSGRRRGPVWEEIATHPGRPSTRGRATRGSTGAAAKGDPRVGLGSETEEHLDVALAALEDACCRLRSAHSAGPGRDASWVAAGAEQAARYGFDDAYTLTKALAERLIERHRGRVPVAIVRPAIVESALAEPFPGWIEAVRVADPLLLAYGRGLGRRLPGTAGAKLPIVPVDLVVNAILAALADLRPGAGGEAPRIFQVSSDRNPLTLENLLRHSREGFGRAPLRDEAGRPIEVCEARLVPPERFRRALEAQRAGRRRTRFGRRVLDHLIRLVDVYRPYLGAGARYEDAATRGLWARLEPDERGVFPFDATAIDWRSYIADVHVPGLVRYALKAQGGAPSPAVEAAEPAGAAAARAGRASSVFELFKASAETAPETVAFQTCRQGRWLRYTYHEALIASGNIAWRLATTHGIRPGDRVGLWASGRPEWVLTLFALHRLGAVAVPLDPQWPAAEVEAAARFVGARLVCAAPELMPQLAETELETVALSEPFVPAPEVGPLPGSDGLAAPVGADELALLVFTSGTTVAPKAVPLTHGNLLANVRDLVPLMELERERLLSVLPIHHVFELMVGLLVPLAGTSTVSYVAEVKPAEIAWMMGETRPTVLVAVPRLLELLHGGIFQSVAAGGPRLERLFRLLFLLSRLTGGRFGHRLFAKVHRRFGGSLRRIATGGSALDPQLGRSFELMGFRVAEGYGLTETSPVLTVNPWNALRFGSVGKPLPGVEIDIRSGAAGGCSNGAADGAGGDEGEIWVRGANVMRGYHGDAEASAAVLRDGWFDTGDLGRLDADGYLHVSGRKKDVIVTAAGKNVYPEEVEARYRDLPGVAELVVVGLPVDSDGRDGGDGSAAGERITAVVVPSDPAADESSIRKGVRAALDERAAVVPSYQRIVALELWRGDLPKTTTLKVQRARLREAIVAGKRTGATAASAPRPAADDEPERSEEQVWVLATLARLTRSRPELLVGEDRLDDLGMDSLARVELIGALEERLGVRLEEPAASALTSVSDLLEIVAGATTRHARA